MCWSFCETVRPYGAAWSEIVTLDCVSSAVSRAAASKATTSVRAGHPSASKLDIHCTHANHLSGSIPSRYPVLCIRQTRDCSECVVWWCVGVGGRGVAHTSAKSSSQAR